jgi:hypothetical protein
MPEFSSNAALCDLVLSYIETSLSAATRMGIVRNVLLGLENRAGCIFSLLLNAFEWSSGNIVEESFFDKYFVEKLKVPTLI